MNKRGTKLNGSSGMGIHGLSLPLDANIAIPTVPALRKTAVHELYTNNHKIKNRLNLAENSGSLTAVFLVLPKLCAL